MKKILLFSMLIVLAFLLMGCTTTDVKYESGFAMFKEKGEVNILLSRAVPQLTVVMDDKILLNSRWVGTRRVNIQNIPDGEHTIELMANSWQLKENFSYTQTIKVDSGKAEVVMLDVPQYSAMYWVYRVTTIILPILPSVVVVYK